MHGRDGIELLWNRLGTKRTAGAALTAAALTAVGLAAAPSLWATSDREQALAAPAVGETAFEVIGRDDQPDLSHAVYYGYLSHVSGIPDAALFSAPERSEATARITFRVNLVLDAHLVLQPLFVTTGTGTLTFYQHGGGAPTFGDPDSFARAIKRLDQLEDNIAATELSLTGEELDALDAVSALPAEYPGWMFERQGARAQQLAESGRPGVR